MSTHPSQLKLFKKWAKAMEEGAIVGKPSYPGTANPASGARSHGSSKLPRRKRRRRTRARKKTQD